MGSLDKQLDWGPWSLPGALDIGPTFPIPSFLFLSLLKTLRGEVGAPAGTGSRSIIVSLSQGSGDRRKTPQPSPANCVLPSVP